MTRRHDKWKTLLVLLAATALAPGAFAARDVALIHLNEKGCPTEVTAQTKNCGDEDPPPGRFCRYTTATFWQPNRNKVLWQYADQSARDPFTIVFQKPDQPPESPVDDDCGFSIDSRSSGRPKTPKCTIDADAADGKSYHYTVVVHRADGDCEHDPHIYVRH